MTGTMILTGYISGSIFVGVIAGIFSDIFASEDKYFDVFLLTVFWPMVLAAGVAWVIIFAPYFTGWMIRRVFTK